METIGLRLKAFRESVQLSKKAFADEIGMDHGLYGRYEADANKPSYETFQKMASSFPKLNLSWLLVGMGNMLHNTRATPPLPSDPVETTMQPQSDLSESERTAYWKQLAEERGRQLEQAEKREDRLWEQIKKLAGSPDSAEHLRNRSSMYALTA